MKGTLGILLLAIGLTTSVQAQRPTKYVLTGGEVIFSFADISGSSGASNIMRFSPFFNLQSWHVYDWQTVGLFYGIAVRNVGFIADFESADERYKFRTYNLGVPVGFKINVARSFSLYAGYELELPFVYKQKLFVEGEKSNKFTSWFSDRTPTLNHGLFAGIQFRGGMNLKFKYYVNDFFNEDFEEIIDGDTTMPYADFNANVFYISLTFNFLRNLKVINVVEYSEE